MEELTVTKAISMAMQVGVVTALTSAVFIMAGRWFDYLIGITPVFTLTGAFFGLIASLFFVYRIIKPLQDMAKKENNEKG